MSEIVLGFEKGTGSEVSLKPTHILTGGTTGSGKSVLMRALISRVTGKLNYKIVIVDVKDPPDYSPYFPNIPLYVDDVSDPITIKKILETKNDMMLNFQFPELIKLCQKNDTWEEVYAELCDMLDNAHKKGHRPIHPVREDKLVVLRELMGDMVKEMKTIDFAPKVQIDHPVQVMNLTGLSTGLQQLIIKSVSEYILKHCANTILLIDEFHRIVPSGLVKGGAKEQIRTHIKEGRVKGDFVWASNQTITSTDPEIRKQFQIWVLGRQNDINEAKRVVDQTVQDIGITFKDVYRLPQGFFLMNDFINTRTLVVYVWPDKVLKSVAQAVAMGQFDVNKVAARLTEETKKENKIIMSGDEDEEMFRQKYEEALRRIAQLEAEGTRTEAKHSAEMLDLQGKITKLMAQLQEQKKDPPTPAEIEELDGGIDYKVTADDIKIDTEHRPQPRKFNTGDVRGVIIYMFTQEKQGLILKISEIKTKAQEYGWNYDVRTYEKYAKELVSEGSLVEEGEGFRLPTKTELRSKVLEPIAVQQVAQP